MKRIILIFLFPLLSINGFSQIKSFEIKSLSKEDIEIKDYIEVFEDSTALLTIKQVASSEYEGRFHKNNLTPRNLSDKQKGIAWGRFKLKNLTGRDFEWYANTNFPFTSLYKLNDSGIFKMQYAGHFVPMNERTLKLAEANFIIFLKSGEEAQFYIKNETNNLYFFPKFIDFILKDQLTVEQSVDKSRIFFTGFTAIELMVILYVIALFIVFREKYYLWLCISLFSSILYFMSFYNIDILIFTSDPLFSIFVKYGQTFFIIPLMIIGQFSFLNSFLEFQKHFGKRIKLLIILISITVIISPLFTLFGRYPFISQISNVFIMSVPLVILFLIIRLTLKGNPLAKIMLYSQGLFLIMVIVSQLIILKIIPCEDSSFISRIILMSAYIIQSLFWIFTIIYKLIILRQEKEEAQLDVINVLKTNEKLILEQNVTLELKVDERTKELVEKNKIINKEKERSDNLLLNILPEEVAEELKEKGNADAKMFDDVTVMFTDFKGFTSIAEKLSAKDLVGEINYCFSAFDNIIHKYGIEKIKTIGDAYMAAGGLPVVNKTHAKDVVKAAIEINSFMDEHKQQRIREGKEIFEIRIGIHTGPVVAGIVGIKKFAYDIWGDTVNLASRMESSGEAGKVNISGSTYELVKNDFTCTYRGKIQAKNKGEIDMYFVS